LAASSDRAAALVIAAAVLFGTTGTAQALGAHGASPPVVGGLRIAIGGLLLAGLALARGRWRTITALIREGHARAALVGAAAVAAYQVCFFSGVATTGVAVGTLVAIGSGPVCAGLLGIVIGERPTLRWAAATALALSGGAVLLLSGRSANVVPAGVLLAFGAGISYAVLTVAGRHLLTAGQDSNDVMTVFFAGAAVLLLAAWLGRDLRPLASPSGVATVAWLGVFATAVPYLLFGRGLRSLPAASVTTLTLAEPLTAALLAVVVLGERPTLVAWLGAALIAAGLVVAAATRPRAPSGTL
jgi:drug/metabolite transporter, DME family